MNEITNDLIKTIIQKVLKEINSAPQSKKILAIICGGKTAAEEGIAEISKLCSAGCDLKVVLTPAGEQIVGKKLQSRLPHIPVFTQDSDTTAIDLLKDTDLIIVPVLTLNSAAKIAHGITDNLATNLIMMGLLNGMPVYAAQDACDIENLILKKVFPDINNPYYKSIFNENLKILQKIGINMTSAMKLGERVLNDFSNKNYGNTVSVEKKVDTFVSPGFKDNVYEGRILSTAEMSVFTGSILRVSHTTLVTPAAKDMARERGIEITTN